MRKLSFILILLVVLLCFGISCSDESYTEEPTVSDWDGTTKDTSWYSKEKTEFTIDSAAQLAGLAKLVNDGTDSFSGKTVSLAKDIDLKSNKWEPIGNGTRGTIPEGELNPAFKGVFDGKNHKILNIKSVETRDKYGAGLFGLIDGATIKNTIIESGYVENENDSASGIVAFSIGSSDSSAATIENCVNKATVKSAAGAGILGRAYGKGKVIISGCENYGNITAIDGTGIKVGGILCINNSTLDSTSITKCSNFGKVVGGDSGTAGIIGYLNSNIEVSECKNKGEIGDGTEKYAGGIVGYVSKSKNATVKECTNEGAIKANENAGGIVGIITGGDSSIVFCTNIGTIIGSDTSNAGGIIGALSDSRIENSKNTAAVHGRFAGGVVGIAGGNGEITNCNGGSETISSPSFKLEFTGQPFILEVEKNQTAGRVLGANRGGGPDKYTKISVADGDSYEDIGTVGICGAYTTWANLEIIGGTFHGYPLAGNLTYIKLTDGVWEDKEKGKTYKCGGLNAGRIDSWT